MYRMFKERATKLKNVEKSSGIWRNAAYRRHGRETLSGYETLL